MAKQLPSNWAEMRNEWPGLTAYQRFEALVASVLTLVVGAVILVALYRLIVSVTDTLLLRALNPLAPAVFQQVFCNTSSLVSGASSRPRRSS